MNEFAFESRLRYTYKSGPFDELKRSNTKTFLLSFSYKDAMPFTVYPQDPINDSLFKSVAPEGSKLSTIRPVGVLFSSEDAIRIKNINGNPKRIFISL